MIRNNKYNIVKLIMKMIVRKIIVIIEGSNIKRKIIIKVEVEAEANQKINYNQKNSKKTIKIKLQKVFLRKISYKHKFIN